MRLNHRSYKTVKRAIMRHLRETNLRDIIGTLDKWECVFCGKVKRKNPVRWTIDHLQPVSRILHMSTHQINAPCNIVLACLRCNTSMGAIGPEHKILRFGRFKNSPTRASEVLPLEYLVLQPVPMASSPGRYLDPLSTSHNQQRTCIDPPQSLGSRRA